MAALGLVSIPQQSLGAQMFRPIQMAQEVTDGAVE